MNNDVLAMNYDSISPKGGCITREEVLNSELNSIVWTDYNRENIFDFLIWAGATFTYDQIIEDRPSIVIDGVRTHIGDAFIFHNDHIYIIGKDGMAVFEPHSMIQTSKTYEELKDMMNHRYFSAPVINPTATEQAKIQKGTETNTKGEQS